MKNIKTNRKRVIIEGNRAKIWGGHFHIDICFTKYPVDFNSVADLLEGLLQEGLDLALSAGEDTGGLETNKTNDEEGQEAFRL